MLHISPSDKQHCQMTTLLIGSPDFCQRIGASIRSELPSVKVISGNYLEAWPLLLANRPQAFVLEIGYHYSERTHAAMRRIYAQARERFEKSLFNIVALVSPERYFFGGDLLFSEETANTSSGFVDTYIATPPGSVPSMPSLTEQVVHALSLCGLEFTRRAEGKMPLPSLGEEGWAQSLADPASRELWMRWLPRYASYTNENPLIIGETGAGKTNLAFALHQFSGRKGEFVGITPRDFSSSELVQAELFGAVSGAYTGAVDKWGLVKKAEKGTLFIDELQSIDKDLQGKLITFIENKAYRRVGSAESVDADVRFVFASNRTLDDMMETDVLRHDFAYRLERVQLELLPLYKRRLDISAALAYALAKVRRQRPNAYPVLGFNSAAYRLLFSHRWPGNLRQLENTVARLCELADMSEIAVVDEHAVSSIMHSRRGGLATTSADIISQAATALSQQALRDSVSSLRVGVERFIETARHFALESTGGDVNRASELIADDTASLTLLAESGAALRNLPQRLRK